MRIAIYTRKSVYVENSESIETQINMIKSYFKKDMACEFEIFEDEGFSGKNTNRPAFSRMMKLAKLKKFDIVAVYKIDRIARNIVDFVNIYDELSKLGVKLVSITEGFDPETPIGKMMMMLLASFADMERMNIAQRVKDNMISLAKKGCFTGGFLPLGCSTEKRDDGKNYIVIIEKEKIKAIFDEYLNVQSLYSTHKNLSERGIKTTSTRENIATVLRSPIYVKSSKEVLDYLSKSYEVIGKANGKGIMTYGKTSGYPTAIVGKHEAVIEPDKWLRIQNILDTKKETAYKKESKVYWLTQILKCPFCGSDYILVNSSYNCYYACSNRLRRNNRDVDVCLNNKYLNASEIESKIEELISLLASKNYKDFKESYNKDEIVFIDNSKEIEKSIIKNTKAIENLVEKLMLLSNAAAVPITAKIEELTLLNEKLKIQLEVEKLKRVESDLKQDNPSIIYDKILRFKDIKNAESKRVAVREIFAKLIYNPFEDSLTYEFI